MVPAMVHGSSDPPPATRFDSLHAIWAWLPTFRAVAETQHVGKAAKVLRISPPAVSRTIKLLESHMGAAPFSPAGRQLVLSPTGHVLLKHVRDAMRWVHEGMAVAKGEHLVGALSISTFAQLAPAYLLPALDELHAAHPQL